MEELIRQIVERQIPITLDVAKVKELRGDICWVESLTTEKDFFKCRINAIETNKQDKLIVTPKENSTVVIGVFKSTEKAVILSVSEAKEIEYKQGTTHFIINQEGYKINRAEKNLFKVLEHIIKNQNNLNDQVRALNDEVQEIIVVNGTSPTIPVLEEINNNTEAIKTNNTNQVIPDLNSILIE